MSIFVPLSSMKKLRLGEVYSRSVTEQGLTLDYYLVQKSFLLTTMPSKAGDTDADISIPD